MENDIAQIFVNKNGYVSVNSRKVVKVYSTEGKEVTTAYLSTTTAVDTAISNDNSELAIAEINYTGSLIQSSIKVISTQKAQTDAENAITYTYKAEKKSIITSICYQENNTLMCMMDSGIIKISQRKR